MQLIEGKMCVWCFFLINIYFLKFSAPVKTSLVKLSTHSQKQTTEPYMKKMSENNENGGAALYAALLSGDDGIRYES